MLRRWLVPSLAALALGCASPADQSRPAARAPGDPGWVTVYDPGGAWNGFTLAFRHTETPILMDMTGRIVHAWPEARVKSRVRLLPDCSILGIATGRGLVRYGWDGEELWRVAWEDRLPHHDLIRLANGNTMVLTLPEDDSADEVLELDADGEVVWSWHAGGPLAEYIENARRRRTEDTTHINSVEELPDNPWYRAGDERFRPGNLLLSARNINLVLIVDRATGDVVWTYQHDLDLQHEARMLPPDDPRAGHIMLFNNRYGSFRGDRQSHVIEIDPRDGTITWSYAAPEFFSGTGGAQQALPNGNVLIASSRGPRAFEVDRDGRTVWQWEPGFGINRPLRYAADHCPELAALGPPEGEAIRPPSGYRHVDREAYRFSRRSHRVERRVGGEKRTLIRPEHACSRILVPHQGAIDLEYGVDRARARAAGIDRYAARFALVARDPASGDEAALFEDTVDAHGPGWHTRTVDLEAYEYRRVELCLTASEADSGAQAGPFALWGAPLITSARDRSLALAETPEESLTPEELEVRREHLRAMGYVN